MTQSQLHVLVVIGSLGRKSSTRVVLNHVANQLRTAGNSVDVLDLSEQHLPLFNPESSHAAEGFPELKARVDQADALVLGTPDYHGSISSTLKNFLDHFWHEFAGKLFASVVASYEKGLTVTDQIRTVARQCYAWSLPYAVSFVDKTDLKDDQISSDPLRQRLDMLVRDLKVYGELLATQRKADLAGTDPGFMAKLRPTGN